MDIDVEALYGRRNDARWNRVAVGDIFERMSWSDPEKVALIAAPDCVADPRYTRLTYAFADETANRVANAFLAQGLERGDRVGLLCENSSEAYLTKMAIAKAGLVALPINTMMADDMVADVLERVRPSCVVVDVDLWAARETVFTAAGIPPLVAVRSDLPTPNGVAEFHDFAQSAEPDEPDVRIHGDDIWEILLTSGTTSMPKAVMVSHTYSYFAAMSHALSYTRNLRHESDVRTCSFLPMIYHIGDHAHVLSAFLSGGSVVLGRRHTSPGIAASVTHDHPTTLWGGSPQFLSELATEVESQPDRYDLTSLKVIVYGWSAMPPDLIDRLTVLCGDQVQFVGIFGQTEAIACHRFWPSRWPELHRRTAPEINYVGIPTPLLGSKVVDTAGDSIQDRPRALGEAVYRSPAMHSGYYLDEAATQDAFRDGWFHSGDLCTLGEDGLRIMVDRSKDVVKSGGENVSSIRVESVLYQHPSVQRAAVIGLPDSRWGEAVTAVVVARPGMAVEEADVIAFCRARLAGYETPKRVVVRDDLPSTVGGKVLKYRLREMLGTTG